MKLHPGSYFVKPLFVLHGVVTLSLVRLPLVVALHKVSFPTSSPDAENLICV